MIKLNIDIEDIIAVLKKNKYFNEWYSYVKDILESPEFQKRKLYLHHDDSVYHHCISVSFESYLLASKLHADKRICAIAGLLHDFYPKAWQFTQELYEKHPDAIRTKRSLLKMHGFVHAKEAAKNYQKYYPNLIDKKITNTIKTHMFPLTIVPPRYKEGWIVSLADKIISFRTINIKSIPKLLGLSSPQFKTSKINH